jgi:hypothetical protein
MEMQIVEAGFRLEKSDDDEFSIDISGANMHTLINEYVLDRKRDLDKSMIK